MATKLTSSTELPNGNELSTTLTWENDTKARRILGLYAESRDIGAAYPDATPQQTLNYVAHSIAKDLRAVAIRQHQHNASLDAQASAEDEIGPEPT